MVYLGLHLRFSITISESSIGIWLWHALSDCIHYLKRVERDTDISWIPDTNKYKVISAEAQVQRLMLTKISGMLLSFACCLRLILGFAYLHTYTAYAKDAYQRITVYIFGDVRIRTLTNKTQI